MTKGVSWGCSHCSIKTGGMMFDCGMPQLCEDCHKEFQRYWLEWITKKFPEGMPMWYVTWNKHKDRKTLCIKWNCESMLPEKVTFT